MKKFFLISLVLLIAIFCVACGGNSNDTNTDANKDTSTDTTVTPKNMLLLGWTKMVISLLQTK